MCHLLREQKNSLLPNPHLKVFTKEHYGCLQKTPYRKDEDAREPSKFLWMDTVFVHFRCDLETTDTGGLYSLNDLKFSEYPATFKIVFQKSSSRYIYIEFLRVFSDSINKPGGEHFLRIFFEVANSLNPGKYTDMPIYKIVTSVRFPVNDFYDLDFSCDKIVVKCSIWKYVQASFVNEASAFYDQMLVTSVQEDHLLTPATYGDMSYLMDREGMRGFFMAGESEDFSNRKFLILKRTFLFAGDLAGRLRCSRENMTYNNSTPIALILGHICNGIIHHIENRECLQLLKMSCMYGLPYLQRECSIFLSQILDDYDFLVDVLLEASKIEHWMLLDIALSRFIIHKESVISCDRWKELMTYNPEQVHILDSLRRRKTAFL